MTLLHTKVH